MQYALHIDQNPDDDTARYNYADLLSTRLEEYEAALEQVDALLEQDPDRIDVLLLKGLILCQAGEYSQAETLYLEIAHLHPNAVLNLAFLYKDHLDEPEQALRYFRMYLAYSGISYKIFEVAKYATWPGLTSPLQISMITSLDAYNKLPKEYKALLNEQAKKWSQWCYDVRGPAVDKYVQEHGPKDFNAQMIYWSPETVKEFLKLSAPIWDTFRKKSPDCAALVELQEKTKDF